MRRRLLGGALGSFLVVVSLASQERTRSVWDGVYTSEQAVRGETAYMATCTRCHGDTLQGRQGRALVGNRFWQDWGEDSLNSLYTIIRDTMPRESPTKLTDEAYIDVTAYILARNGYPLGTTALTVENVRRIQVTRKEGPGPVPNFALVTVVGCLSEATPGTWTLVNGSEPVRTRNPNASSGDERQKSDATRPGDHTFELMDVYSAGNGHSGHRMEVKGLLIRGSIDKVNLTSMQMLGSDCQREQ